jgi:hypothetical protein
MAAQLCLAEQLLLSHEDHDVNLAHVYGCYNRWYGSSVSCLASLLLEVMPIGANDAAPDALAVYAAF